MHKLDGHYLNLPVMNEAGEIVGMVDVLKLTYATLEQVSTVSSHYSNHFVTAGILLIFCLQINSMGSQDEEGPAWNKFWLSMDHESDSMVSGSNRPHTPHGHSILSPDPSRPGIETRDSVLPNESASHHGDDHSELVASPKVEVTTFPFKFKAPSGRVHRINVLASAGIAELVSQVTAKLGPEVEAVGGVASCEEGKLSNGGYALSYMDNEGDTVSITTDQDLADAISLARRSHRDKVDLFVHDPSQPPIPATLEPQPVSAKAVTPVEERSVLAAGADEPVEESAKPNKSRTQTVAAAASEEQFIAGVPNDLLLPGAIVTLAAVIAGVFILSRSSSR